MPDDDVTVRPWQRWLVTVLGFLVVVHSVLLMLWLAPSSPIRDVVGTRNLASYVDPYFQQDVGAVDPSVQFVDESFQIRALVDDGAAKPKVTEWVDLTLEEVRGVRFDVSPARVHLIARRLATNINQAMFGLEPSQRKILRETKASAGVTERRTALNAAADNRTAVQNYLAYDQMATQFASLYATAQWEGELIQVQYRVGRRTVPAYSERDKTSLLDVDYLWFAFGWRPVFRGSVDAQSAFDSYVKG